ncbi:hypothetical protein DRF75_01890 [Ehrlichia minasensis]|uniref:Uncharacterized protein n=1 Tax=Ehrlichia minasensis TaxID=1242993 RepID=A0A4Q6I6M3_9RICK|nr:hypothetical protein [Ehrlichia minasensis]RZB12843.1 hypothetical protein DRF75_01890 [Ehrlichia minasensis]CEI85175.1 Uncharacterized protein ehr_00561 [Ehrlichia minasensis]
MLFYRYMLFFFLLKNIKNLIIRVFFILVFLYFSSFIFIAMKEGIKFAFAYKDPKNVAIYIYKYSKWCYYNYDSLTYSIFFKAGVSLIIPFWFYLKVSKINWNEFFRCLFEYVCSIFKKDSHSKENLEFNNYNDFNFIDTNHIEEIDKIKKNAIAEIEESINKMVSNILCVKNKKNNQNYDNVIDRD